MGTLRALKFLVMAPLLVMFLFAITLALNVLSGESHWWVQWAAFGLGIAWLISLFKVIRALVVGGGLAALGALLYRRR